MMKHTNAVRWTYVPGGLLLVLALVMTGFGQKADSSESTYTWHSELVELDESQETVTLKNRILSYAEVDDFASFDPGDRISLTWSGMHGRASGLRAVKAHSSSAIDTPFVMPAEFVSTELDDRYLTFRLPISGAGIEALEQLEPGDWVTLTSPHAPRGLDDVVMHVRPYAS